MPYSTISGCLLRHGQRLLLINITSQMKQYNGKDLVKALSLKSSRWLTNMMKVDPNYVPKDHIEIFR
jgi:hypothetical protein